MNDIELKVKVSAAHAARTGQDQCGEGLVRFKPSELTTEARDVLAALLAQPNVGEGSVIHVGGHSKFLKDLPPLSAPGGAWQDWLEALAAEFGEDQQRQRIKREAEIQAILVEPLDKWVTHTRAYAGSPRLPDGGYFRPGPVLRMPGDSTYDVSGDPRIAERRAQAESVALAPALAQWQAEFNQAEKEATARVEAEMQAEKEAEAEKAKAESQRAAFLAGWLTLHGTEAMRKRAARGLLPQEDLLGAFRDWVFLPLQHMPRFERLTDDEVRQALGLHQGQGVDYETRDADTATDADIEKIEEIEKAIPQAKVTLREHVGFKDGADPGDPECSTWAIRVEVQHEGIKVTREYATCGAAAVG